MKHIKTVIFAALLLLGMAAVVPAQSVFALDPLNTSCDNAPADDPICASSRSNEQLFGPNSVWTRIINTMIFVIGAIAIVMIVIGGLRYTLSGGDQSATTSAKNTIIYAVVGLIVSIMSYAIVNFVFNNI